MQVADVGARGCEVQGRNRRPTPTLVAVFCATRSLDPYGSMMFGMITSAPRTLIATPATITTGLIRSRSVILRIGISSSW